MLRDCCAGVAEHELWIVVVEGDAGIGKTRLLAELPALAREHSVQLAGAGCDSIAHDRPFGPLLEALHCDRTSSDPRRRAIAQRSSSLARPSGVPPSPSTTGQLELGARYGVQDELVELLLEEADSRPLLLVIDDSQWLDGATASTLGALIRRRGNRPIGLVLAARPDPRPAELEMLFHRWHEDLETLRLGPLTAAVVSEVAADVLGRTPPADLVEELERAGGNAFSVVALARGYDEHSAGPLEGVRASVLSRVHRLGEEATGLLAIAAVLGVEFTPETLAVLGDRAPFEVFDVLYGATRAGLLVSRGSTFAFSHALVAEQLVSEVPAALQSTIHRSIVHHAGELQLGATTIAHHVMAASMPDDVAAIDALCRAAEEVSIHEPLLALGYLDHAAALCGRRCGRHSELALRRATALCTLKRVTEAIDVLQAALLIEHDRARIAEVRAALARCSHLLGDLTSAADEFEQLARSGALSPAAEAAAWADVATYRFWSMRGAHPWAEADRAIEIADASGAVAPAVQAIAAQATMAAFAGDVQRGVELAAQASARGRLLAHDVVIPSPAFTEGLARMLADDLAGAIDVLQLDRLRIERLGDPLLAGRPATALVIAQYLAGRWDDALAEASAISSVCSDTGSAVGQLVAPVIRGLIAHYRGDVGAARAALSEATSITGAQEAYAVPFLLHLQALELERNGSPTEALALLADTAAVARSLAPAIRSWFVLDAARLIVTGTAVSPDIVDGLLDGLTDDAARTGRDGPAAIAAITAAAIADDLPTIVGALGALRRSPQLLTRSAGLELAGLVCWRRGASEAGRAILAEARAGYEQLGAMPAVQRVVSITAGSAGGRRAAARPARPKFGWDALTPAELAVLEMVADAKRNAEIAEQLVLSKRTVESHISSMLVKLGVRTRVELVVAAARHRAG